MHSIPPRITEKSYRLRVSNRTMVGVLEPPRFACVASEPKASNHQVMKPDDQLLREGREWPDTTGRQGWIDPTRAGLLDEDSAPAVDRGHGSDDLHLHHLPHQEVPVAQRAASVSDLGRHHMALRKEITSQAVGDPAGIDLVVLLFGRCNRSQHQRVSHLDLGGVRKQMIVDPAAEEPGLRPADGDRSGVQQATATQGELFP
jgi:hypothetical protein